MATSKNQSALWGTWETPASNILEAELDSLVHRDGSVVISLKDLASTLQIEFTFGGVRTYRIFSNSSDSIPSPTCLTETSSWLTALIYQDAASGESNPKQLRHFAIATVMGAIEVVATQMPECRIVHPKEELTEPGESAATHTHVARDTEPELASVVVPTAPIATQSIDSSDMNDSAIGAPSIEDTIEECDFFMSQELFDDAIQALIELSKHYPGESVIEFKLAEVRRRAAEAVSEDTQDTSPSSEIALPTEMPVAPSVPNIDEASIQIEPEHDALHAEVQTSVFDRSEAPSPKLGPVATTVPTTEFIRDGGPTPTQTPPLNPRQKRQSATPMSNPLPIDTLAPDEPAVLLDDGLRIAEQTAEPVEEHASDLAGNSGELSEELSHLIAPAAPSPPSSDSVHDVDIDTDDDDFDVDIDDDDDDDSDYVNDADILASEPASGITPLPDGIERRTSPRVPLNVEVSWGSEHNFYTGFTNDISEGGLFIATEQRYQTGDRLQIAMELPGLAHTASIDVEVRWVRELDDHEDSNTTSGIGVRFVNLTPEIRSAIQSFIGQRDSIFYDDE